MNALLFLFACEPAEPPVVIPPAEFIGTWRGKEGIERWVWTADGAWQHTDKNGWSASGKILSWTSEGFAGTGFPVEERHAIQRGPFEREGYTWVVIDEIELWRQSKEARIGAPIPRPVSVAEPTPPEASTTEASPPPPVEAPEPTPAP